MRNASVLCGLSLLLCLGALLTGAEPDVPEAEKGAEAEFAAGNFKVALELYQKLALRPTADPETVVRSLNQAGHAMQRLGRESELDAFREEVVRVHAKQWKVLQGVAQSYLNQLHHGFIVEGEFVRGNRRSSRGAEYADASDRDRVRALQLMQQAMPLIKEASPAEQGEFYLTFARTVLFNQSGQTASWKLQALTDLSELPDYTQGQPHIYGRGGFRGFGSSGTAGAPVDAQGNPVFYSIPATWEAASNDGERWRWLLNQAQSVHPPLTNRVRWEWANFLQQNFGVQTMLEVIRPLMRQMAEEGTADSGEGRPLDEQTGPFAVSSLKETETIARLATGVKRFALPDEYNHIKVLQQIVAEPETGYAEQALGQLAQIFENRQQYPRAAEYWQESIANFKNASTKNKQQRLSQIVDPWGTFEGTGVQSTGAGAEVEFRFRNGEELQLEAFTVNYTQLLKDVKAYLKSNPQKFDWQNIDIGNIGHRLVYENEKKYLGKSVAKWTQTLEPREGHFDRRVTVATPLKNAGAYLLVARLKNGNTSRIIVWLEDLAIIKKPLDGAQWYFVADALTGAPVAKAKLDFFGYKIERPTGKRFNTLVSQVVDQTDAEGQVTVGQKRLGEGYNWLTTATAPDGRVAFMGFNGVWFPQRHWETYQQNKVFIITDRPVYRPGQKVQFKAWVRRADFENQDKAAFAGQKFKLEISNPRDEKLLEKEFTADEFGGFSGEIELPQEATLGQYQISIPWNNEVGGGNSFRVEEYKKPEFEVTVDAPAEPVQLGEKITATVRAKYYFGAPVTHATVKYKVERTAHNAAWFPPQPWDWLYGNGFWWFGNDYGWYPGFQRWGCIAPIPPWGIRGSDPPETVLENEVPIGPDGSVTIEIDTALAKALQGDEDHQYTITAEVVDQSRRTIVGSGSVLAAREPFQVHVWVDRGYYHAGDVVTASIKAQTIDQKPISGQGELKLYSIRYDEKGTPNETLVESWNLQTDAQGAGEQKFKAAEAGQYRLSYTLTDAKGNTQEGAFIFLVRGDGSSLEGFRFNDLEIIPDQKTYQPGETVHLLVNTNRRNATVLLFIRPSNGVYLPPQTLRLDGKSTLVDVGVELKDMPNFFIEAVTLSDAQVYQEVREIAVPPEERVINVEVTPSSDRYLPGQEAEVTLKLTDLAGEPIFGQTVLTVYDRSVEYISGGSNVPEIREFFWQFRRSHHPTYESSLQRYFHNLLKKDETGMQNLGVFGHLSADSEALAGGGMGGFGGGLMSRTRNLADDFMMEKSMAMPMAAPMAEMQSAAEPGAAEELVQPTIRKEFADTAYWNALLLPDDKGIVKVKFPMPENLTDWTIKAWSMGQGTRVGQGQASAVTAKDVLVRLQAPRFFIQKDEVILSAIVHNYLKEAKSARVELVLEGGTLEPLDDLQRTVTVEAGGEVRVDWKVKAVQEGSAVITVKALTDADSDAMQMTFPVFVHGMLKTESFTGVLRSQETAGKFIVNVPAERRAEQTRLEIRYSPTLAGALVDALPYLIDYPYGCTEQTLNRFLPSVITQNVLKRMGVELEEIEKKRTNLNAQELGDAAERAAQWKRFDRNPVFSSAEMEEIVKVGLKTLADMQLSDGGWGWFSGRGERSYPHTTATVVRGLQVAVENGLILPEGMLENGVQWLEKYQTEQLRLLKRGEAEKPEHPYRKFASDLDALVYMVLVDAGINSQPMQDYLYRDRTKLSVYSLAMFGLSLHKLKVADRFDMVLQNIEQYYVEDLENETAYLKLPAGTAWWFWYGNEIEANAYYLKLLSKTDPEGVRAPRLVKYLLNNRKHSTYWNSTRDTALCIEAFADFLKESKEDQPELTLEVVVDGEVKKTVTINRDNLFSFDGTAILAGEELSSGEHTIEFRKTGNGPLYWNAYLTNFTLEDPITATGLELKVRRKVYKLVEQENAQAQVAGSRGQVIEQSVTKYDRVELQSGDQIQSGDLLEIELGIDSKNDYEYILLEDFKAAGNEPVDVQSGYLADANGAYVEFRDEKVAFFMRTLPRGTSSMSYRLRAEIPGTFSALPTVSYGMYAPELKANSDEFKFQIQDR